MSKVYPSNLTYAQYEFLRDLLPEAKSGGRPRTVDLWEILNAIFYVLMEGVRWRALPGDFPAWQTVYTYFRNWRRGLPDEIRAKWDTMQRFIKILAILALLW